MKTRERFSGRSDARLQRKLNVIEAAAGRKEAEVVIKNASFVNVFGNELGMGDIAISEGMFVGIGSYCGKKEIDASGKIVVPGFIDAHIHLESSLVKPSEFVKAVVPHGTTTVVADPHEIANVMGADGVAYMLQATEALPVNIRFMLPSCVPATPVDESGANLDWRALDEFYDHPRVQGLAEMMNYDGVISADPEVVEKIVAALSRRKKIDGHAPGLEGLNLNAYIAAGVYSDHECYELNDAIRKLDRGQYIMIREGTAAHNLDALLPLLKSEYADRCMFCCDDKHPSDLMDVGHIDHIVKRAIRAGVDPIVAIKAASYNAARYFLMNNRGAIAPGFLADFMIIDNFTDFNIEWVFRKGAASYADGAVTPFPEPEAEPFLIAKAHDTFHTPHLSDKDFMETRPCAVIGVIPGEIITEDCGYSDKIDADHDILKIAVVERHKNTRHIGIGYLKGYGLKAGAIATSVSHDSHNIIAVGANEKDMAFAVNSVIENKGGVFVVKDETVSAGLRLSIAGVMSDDTLENVNRDLENAKEAAFALGVKRGMDPFMTLSFMALPVIPTLRITTRGVINVL
ncbi:MAG: adenine deaminase [Clostridia bacterium]|nr:adenine deaminase [Clostridia bacterium]